jgi:hypothetical protein
MKASTTLSLLFATLALANPAAVGNPRIPGSLARPEVREAAPAPADIVARTAGIVLDSRSPKKGSSSSGSSNKTEDSAAETVTVSRGLQLGALGLGVLEVVRLWV